jgi:hypothetical protein
MSSEEELIDYEEAEEVATDEQKAAEQKDTKK